MAEHNLEQQEPSSTPATGTPTSTSAEKINCLECGYANPAGSSICENCGEPLTVPPPPGVEPLQTQQPTVPQRRISSSARDYMLASFAILAVTIIAYVAAGPEPYRGQPATAQTQPQAGASGETGALPPGHPAMPAGPTPEQQKMISEMQAEVQANPNDVMKKLRLANLYYDTEQFPEALPLYQDYLKEHPQDDSARSDMAVALFATRDMDKAITELKGINRRSPKFQPATLNLFMVYVGKRDRDSAEYWLRQTIDIDPNSPQGVRAKEILAELQQMPRHSDSTQGM